MAKHGCEVTSIVVCSMLLPMHTITSVPVYLNCHLMMMINFIQLHSMHVIIPINALSSVLVPPTPVIRAPHLHLHWHWPIGFDNNEIDI